MLGFSILMLYPFKIAEFKTPIELKETVLEPGGTLEYTIDYCKYWSIKGIVIPNLTNDVLFELAHQNFNTPVGCHKLETKYQLPTFLPPGEYELIFIIEYKPFPFRTITYTTETEKFIIRKK